MHVYIYIQKRSVKVHCRRWWHVTLELSGSRGVEKEGESRIAQTREVGEVVVNLLEERKGYVDVTWMEAGVRRVTWVRVLWRNYKRASIVNLTK